MPQTRRTMPLVSLVAAFVLTLTMAPVTAAEHGPERASEVVPGHYVVTLTDDAEAAAVARQYQRRGADVGHVYRRALNGFAGSIPPALLERLERDERIAQVEPEQVITPASQTTQTNPPSWGIDRVDQRTLPLDNEFSYTGTGEGVQVYVVDSGVRSTHQDFAGRVAPGFDALGGSSTEDCNGHGTTVTGPIAGEDHGIAKDATIVPVRIFDCDGSTTASTYYAGLDWILDHHDADAPGVVNLSLVSRASSTGDAAVRELIDHGLVVAAAAGNDGSDACDRSPAREPSVLTVGGTQSDDARASWSNHGECVDLFAPGRTITAPSHSSDTGTRTASGTSMSTPHVAGAAAVLLGADPDASPAEIHERILSAATAGVVRDARDGSPDRLLFADPDVGVSTDEPVEDPVAEFSADCTDLSCEFDASSSSASEGEIDTYDWELGDGVSSDGESPTHSYAEEGTYEVTLTVIDEHGGTDTATESITVSAPEDSPEDDSDSDGSDSGDSDSDDSSGDDSGENDSSGEDSSGDGSDDDAHPELTLDGSAERVRNTWTASATVATAPASPGEVISYQWESHRGSTGAGECTTGDDGTCTVEVSASFQNREQWVEITASVDGSPGPSSSITIER